MDKAFDTAFDAMMAWNQVGLFVGGLICLGIGLLFIADFVHWRVVAQRVKGRIAAVRVTGINKKKSGTEDSPAVSEKPEDLTSLADELKKSPGRLFGNIFLSLLSVVPLVLLFSFAAYTAFDYLHLKADGYQVEAAVIDNEISGENADNYRAVVSFEGHDGQYWELRDSMVVPASRSYEIGRKIDVYYDPADPSHFKIVGFWHYQIFRIALSLIVTSLIVGVFIVIAARFEGRLRSTGSSEKKKKKVSYAGEMYSAVMEYAVPDGETIQAETDSSSNWLADKIPGTPVKLLVKPHDPESVRKVGWLGLIAGLIFAVPGALLLFVGIGMGMNIFTIVIGAAGLGYLGFKLFKTLRPRGEWDSIADFQKRMKAKSADKSKQGRILTHQEIRDRLRYHDRVAQLWQPFLVLMAAGFIGGGIYMAQDMEGLLAVAERTEGHVVRVESVYNASAEGSSYTYYPVIEYADFTGRVSTFRSKVGSNPPTKKIGDSVTVMYDPDRPGQAQVDRGILNWLIPGGLLLAGLWLLWVSLKIQMGIFHRKPLVRRRGV